MTPTAHRLALFGHPVAHSLSPAIHAAFAAQADVPLSYDPIDADVSAFPGALAAFADAGGTGANVTLPLKHAAAALCATLDPRAARMSVVNTLVRRDGGWHGDNTDGVGLVRDLTERHALDLRGRRVLVIGAGGAAAGVVPALLDAGIDELYLVNRSSERADALVDAIGEPGRVHSRYLADAHELGEFSMVVHATSATRGGMLPPLPMSLLASRATAVDLNYGEAAIPFLAWARAGGALHAIDGLGMLVEQAAESFALWHGERPQTDAVYAQLRAHAPTLSTAD